VDVDTLVVLVPATLFPQHTAKQVSSAHESEYYDCCPLHAACRSDGNSGMIDVSVDIYAMDGPQVSAELVRE
jgi:hypothetical protein